MRSIFSVHSQGHRVCEINVVCLQPHRTKSHAPVGNKALAVAAAYTSIPASTPPSRTRPLRQRLDDLITEIIGGRKKRELGFGSKRKSRTRQIVLWRRQQAVAPTQLTSPSVERDLLILAASRSRSPLAPVAFALSDPARSTRQILLVRELLIV